ncbi:hypothetical protein V3C99_006246 [Haemonchus contortus]
MIFTRISSTATSTCLPTVLGKTDMSSFQLSLPKFDTPSRSPPPVTVKTLARFLVYYLSGCEMPTSWALSDQDGILNYRSICLLFVIYKLFTHVILTRIGRILNERQLCEQAVSERIQCNRSDPTVTRLTEVSREYKMPLCLSSVDMEETLDTTETDAVIKALVSQGVPTQYIRMLRELYSNCTTSISPFDQEFIANVNKCIHQGDSNSPKIFNATFESDWENLGVKSDTHHLHHLRFADHIALVTPNRRNEIWLNSTALVERAA